MNGVFLTRAEVEVLVAFAENGMKVQRTANALHYDKRTVSQRLTLINANTGINPRDFYGLTKLLDIINAEKGGENGISDI